MSLPAAMASFVRLAPTSAYTMVTLTPHVPEEIGHLLTYGVGYIGDGFLRTVDPATLADVTARLASPIHAAHSFPILTSAFGDVVTFWRSRLHLINSRLGRYLGLGHVDGLAQLITELSDPGTREFFFGPQPWTEAVHAFGVPTPKECFAFVPPLAVMPRKEGDLTGVEKVDLRAHLEFLATFYGPAQGRL